MKPDDKELLLKDLSARLPYGVKVQYNGSSIRLIQAIGIEGNEPYFKSKEVAGWLDVGSCKPYLRPMSSMTEEEARDIAILHGNELVDILSIKVTNEYIDIILDDGVCGTVTSTIWYDEIISSVKCFDWLNKKMFDFRGLIPKDLALSTEEFNPYID